MSRVQSPGARSDRAVAGGGCIDQGIGAKIRDRLSRPAPGQAAFWRPAMVLPRPHSRGHHPAPQAAVFKAVSYMDAIRGLAMTGRKRAGGEKKATTVVANHPDDLKGV